MKKFLFLIALACPVFLLAQPTKHEVVLSVNSVDPSFPLGNFHEEDKYLDGGDYTNTSFAIGLIGKYFISESVAWRLRAIYTNRNIHDRRDITTGAHSIYDERFRQSLWKIAPGLQWGFNNGHISFFGGLEFPITIIGKMTHHEDYSYESLDSEDKEKMTTDNNTPGGFSARPGLFIGSNFYIGDRFAIGFDIASAYQYSSVGGKLTSTSQDNFIAGGNQGNIIYTNEHDETIRQFKFSPIQAAINFTFKLNRGPGTDFAK